MRITTYESQVVQLPADEPLADGPSGVHVALRRFVTLTLRTDQGVHGIGVTFFGAALTGALKAAVDSFAELCIGEDPRRREFIIQKLRGAAVSAGPEGIFCLALAAIDIALWDIQGKLLNQPLARLFGGHRERVPTYASGALMRDFSLDHVVKAAPRLVERGFRQMKAQLALLGQPTVADEIERIRRIREAIGFDIDLMVDINQRWDVRQAISIGRQIEDQRLYWLEDVTACDDYAGLARVSDALAMPVAGGEYVWGIVPMRHMVEARAVDIVMIDLVRAGGITPWLKIAAMAEAFNLPVVSHLLPEFHVHLIAGVPNGLTVEYMPWSLCLFQEPPAIVDGQLVVPERPGLGLEFDPAALKKYAA
jgi:L-alanine-DL-glutamate epimerase-like enolase superfamily enzyme